MIVFGYFLTIVASAHILHCLIAADGERNKQRLIVGHAIALVGYTLVFTGYAIENGAIDAILAQTRAYNEVYAGAVLGS